MRRQTPSPTTPRTTLLPPQPPASPTLSKSATTSSSSSSKAPKPIPYTGSPLNLCLYDARLLFHNAWTLPGILFPLRSATPTPLDELYPSPANLYTLALHGFLLVVQTGFLLSLIGVLFVPGWVSAAWCAGVGGVVWVASRALNGSGDEELESRIMLGGEEELERYKGECWIFLNGVAVGYVFFQIFDREGRMRLHSADEEGREERMD